MKNFIKISKYAHILLLLSSFPSKGSATKSYEEFMDEPSENIWDKKINPEVKSHMQAIKSSPELFKTHPVQSSIKEDIDQVVALLEKAMNKREMNKRDLQSILSLLNGCNLLEDQIINPNIENNRHQTLLHVIVDTVSKLDPMNPANDEIIDDVVSMIYRLISYGANPCISDPHGLTPLREIIRSDYDHPLIVDALLSGDHGQVDTQIKTPFSDSLKGTPLHWAAFKGKIHTAQVLIDKGADVNAQDAHRRTPLRWARRAQKSAMIELLLKNGAQDSDQITPKQAERVHSGHSKQSNNHWSKKPTQ